jgi:PmbA protein
MSAPSAHTPLALTQWVVERARQLGADEVAAQVSIGTHNELEYRDGAPETASHATSHALGFSLLVNDRYSSHSTSDLRPDSIETLLRRAIAATRLLEPDPDRALAPAHLCGAGTPPEALDLCDPAWNHRTPDDREAAIHALEASLRDRPIPDTLSITAGISDGSSRSAMVMSNGFVGESAHTSFSASVGLSFRDGEKRPQVGVSAGTRHLEELPVPSYFADELVQRVRDRRGAGPIPSVRLPMLVHHRAIARILGLLRSPLSGGALHQGRSCLADRRGTRIASPLLTIVDDPTLRRGVGSRAWDGDGLKAAPHHVLREGVLENYTVGLYYHRKTGLDLTGGSSNWVVPPGARSPEAILRDLPRVLRVDGFLGGNANAATGDFSFGVQGRLFEHGEPTANVSEMNVAGNLLELLDRLGEVANDPHPRSSVRAPSMLFDAVQFSGS